MKKVLCVVLALLMIVSVAYGESDSGGSTFNFNGGDISNRFYDYVRVFNDGLACVQKGDKWGFINTSGTLVIPCKWDPAFTFSEGMAEVRKDGKWGFIDTTGALVIPCEWDDARSFSDGLARVEKDGKWGYIDKSGTLVIPCEWDVTYIFSEGLAMVEQGEKYGFIDATGALVIPCEWDDAHFFSDGLARVEKDGKWGYIDTTGTVVSPCEWDDTYGFSDGLAMVEKNGKWGYIDASGTLVIPCEWDNASSFSEGLVVVEREGAWYSIDTNGAMVVLGSWDYVSSFSEGLAVVRTNRKYGLIDTSGTLVIPCEWDHADSFIDGLARVEKDDKYGYIDLTGTLVIPCEWDKIDPFIDGLARVEKDDKCGYIDSTGRVVVPCEYDTAYYGEGYFTLLKGGYLTILDREGNEVEIIVATAESGSAIPTDDTAVEDETQTNGTDVPADNSADKAAEDVDVEYETLTNGSKGDAVKKLQQRLNELGYDVGTADGIFGKKTGAAIEKFQQANGLSATGIADAQTQALLYSDASVGNSNEEEGVSELVEFKSMMMESVSEQISSAADLTQTANNRAVLAALLALEVTYQLNNEFVIDTTQPIFVTKQGNIAAAAFGGEGKYVMVIYQSKPLSTSYGFIYSDNPSIIKATLEASSESVWTVSVDDMTEKMELLVQQLQ